MPPDSMPDIRPRPLIQLDETKLLGGLLIPAPLAAGDAVLQGMKAVQGVKAVRGIKVNAGVKVVGCSSRPK